MLEERLASLRPHRRWRRGFAAHSICKVMTRLGITGGTKKKAIWTITDAAEKASRYNILCEWGSNSKASFFWSNFCNEFNVLKLRLTYVVKRKSIILEKEFSQPSKPKALFYYFNWILFDKLQLINPVVTCFIRTVCENIFYCTDGWFGAKCTVPDSPPCLNIIPKE